MLPTNTCRCSQTSGTYRDQDVLDFSYRVDNGFYYAVLHFSYVLSTAMV